MIGWIKILSTVYAPACTVVTDPEVLVCDSKPLCFKESKYWYPGPRGFEYSQTKKLVACIECEQ